MMKNRGLAFRWLTFLSPSRHKDAKFSFYFTSLRLGVSVLREILARWFVARLVALLLITVTACAPMPRPNPDLLPPVPAQTPEPATTFDFPLPRERFGPYIPYVGGPLPVDTRYGAQNPGVGADGAR